VRKETKMRFIPLALVLATVLGVALSAPSVGAADSDRAMKWQMTVPITFTSGATIDGEQGTSFDVSDDIGWGFGFGYNLNPHLMFGVDFTWISANYNVTLAKDDPPANGIPDGTTTVSGTLDAGNLQLVAQYNIMKGRFTPFVRGSLGWTWID